MLILPLSSYSTPDQIWKTAHVAETCSVFQTLVFVN